MPGTRAGTFADQCRRSPPPIAEPPAGGTSHAEPTRRCTALKETPMTTSARSTVLLPLWGGLLPAWSGGCVAHESDEEVYTPDEIGQVEQALAAPTSATDLYMAS